MAKKFNLLCKLVKFFLCKKILIFQDKLFSFCFDSATLHKSLNLNQLFIKSNSVRVNKNMEKKSNVDTKIQWSNKYIIGIGVATALYGFWCLAGYYVRASVEKLNYQILSKITDNISKQTIQIRQYPPFLVAQARYNQSEMYTAMNKGFRDIAGFIFGKNKSKYRDNQEKIAMTAPVTVRKSPFQNEYSISFVMPSKYTKQSLPIPNNSKVEIKQKPAQIMASIRWRGNMPDLKKLEQKERELRRILSEHKYVPKGQVYLYEYDPPYTPGWIRINQALLAVEKLESN